MTVIREARTVCKVADSFGRPLGSQGPVTTNEMFPSMSVLQNNRRGRRLSAVDPRIAEAVRRIVAFLSPQRVILYGSRARGDNVPKSDIDLAVDAPPGRHRVRAHFDLLGNLERDPPTLLGIDIVFLDEVGEEFRLRVVREGQVLYEQRAA